MTNDDFKRFGAVWTSTQKIYGVEHESDVLSLVFKALSEFTLQDVEAALAAHVQDPARGKFPPKPADVIAKLQTPLEEVLELGWTEFRKATRSGVMPKDPKLQQVISRLGGLDLLGDKTSRDLDFMRESFQLLYKTAISFERGVITAQARKALQ